jgi:hypothetical protein
MLKNNAKLMLLITVLVLTLGAFPYVLAQQTGATITNMSTTTKPSNSPDWNNGTKGYIHTVNLNAQQQDNKWKAYVGNVSSTFVLDDANDYSIYQWTLDSFSGQIYVTRDSGVTWGSVVCATEANKLAEDTSLNHNSQSADSVNRTFNRQTHKSFTVGTNPPIAINTCYSTVTWQNDADHQLNTTAPFQEVLLWDGGNMIYTAFVENDKAGYRPGSTYDFQAIVPDDGISSNPNVRYYFYLELS